MKDSSLRYPSDKMGQAIIHFLEDVIKGENDRTAIIVATAMLDMQLEDLLKSFLQPKRKQDDELFAPEGPLSTFSSKISLAFRLGILDPDLCAVLDGVRKVRNDFAHDVFARSLNDPPYADRINALATRYRPSQTEFLRGAWGLADTPGAKIRVITQGISAFLSYLRGCVKKPIGAWETQVPKDENSNPPKESSDPK